MTTALEVYDYALRHRFALHLRSLGFKGSGRHYALPHESAWAQVGFQKSRGNTADRVRFTINLSVIDKAAWEDARERFPYYPARPNPNHIYGVSGSHQRIGHLLPGRSDVWWSFATGQESADVLAEPNASDVCFALTEYALPYMLRLLPPPNGASQVGTVSS